MILNKNFSSSDESYLPKSDKIDCRLGINPHGSPLNFTNSFSFEISKLCNYYDSGLTDSIRSRLGKFWDIDYKNIYFENGSMAILCNIFNKLIVSSGKVMLGLGPQFVDAVTEWELSGGKYIKSSSIEELKLNIEDHPGSLIYIDNPNNPTGRIYDKSDMVSLAIKAKEHGSVLVVDEAYGDYLDMDESTVGLTKSYSNVIVVRSFSKGIGLAAIRLGYVVINESLRSFFDNMIIPFCVSLPSLLIASAALDSIEDFLRDSISRTIVTKKEVILSLEKQGHKVLPTSLKTPIMLVKCHGLDATKYFGDMGILVTPTNSYSKTADYLDRQYCRIRIPRDDNQLIEFLSRLSK